MSAGVDARRELVTGRVRLNVTFKKSITKGRLLEGYRGGVNVWKLVPLVSEHFVSLTF